MRYPAGSHVRHRAKEPNQTIRNIVLLAQIVGPIAPSALKALEALGVCAGPECARLPVQAVAADFELLGREQIPGMREHRGARPRSWVPGTTFGDL